MNNGSAITGPEMQIPPFLRMSERGTREASEFALQRIDTRIAKLARLGLRPHPEMMAYRGALALQIANDGPYEVLSKTAYF